MPLEARSAAAVSGFVTQGGLGAQTVAVAGCITRHPLLSTKHSNAQVSDCFGLFLTCARVGHMAAVESWQADLTALPPGVVQAP